MAYEVLYWNMPLCQARCDKAKHLHQRLLCIGDNLQIAEDAVWPGLAGFGSSSSGDERFSDMSSNFEAAEEEDNAYNNLEDQILEEVGATFTLILANFGIPSI